MLAGAIGTLALVLIGPQLDEQHRHAFDAIGAGLVAVLVAATAFILVRRYLRTITALEREVALHREAETALHRSEQRIRDYSETAYDWFWETGLDHRFTMISDALGQWGMTPKSRIGVGRWEFATDRDEEPEKWRRHLETLEAHLPFRDFRYRAPRGDGTPGYISTSGKPIFDGQGNFLGYRGVTSDITAAVRAEQELRRAQEEHLALQDLRIKVEEERLRLLQRIIEAQEQERSRITRDLHDQTGQDLTGLSLGLKSLEASIADDQGAATLRWLQSLTAQIGVNLHRTAWELRPSALTDIGLENALETYTADWSARSGIRVDFQAGKIARRFPDAIETAAYRVVQEALTNVRKHAGATAASVVIDCRDDVLSVIIEDNGHGFDVEAVDARNHLGLAGMSERLALVHGTLAIDSSPSAGTTLYVRIPVGGPEAGRPV